MSKQAFDQVALDEIIRRVVKASRPQRLTLFGSTAIFALWVKRRM